MSRVIVFLYGLMAYAAFFATILYAIGFVGNYVVPKSIDTGVEGPMGQAVLINTLLLGLFAVQHTIMARPGFKRWWTKIIPAAAERSTFVLIASALLMLLFWQWRPITTTVWRVDAPVTAATLQVISLLGWAIVFYASFLIDHFDLFGVRQVYLNLRGREYHHHGFMVRSLYRFVRHPLMVGFFIAFWAAPHMTAGHLMFAIVTSAYIVMGTAFEERDLLNMLGEDYRQYRRRTPMFIPIPKRKREKETRPALR